ncbi:Acyl-coenzyme A thioesterase 13 [Cocos nucifera]|uniref:Acyl-coenzyme A thioesterase 13 n=1 Tax=Cocos nucifera TaxID=13894 RepID=A0A8K0MWI8_COCNU|nr:Acyl-coenzyme A thioesterase 13 [Cocos nucifera]
MGMDKRETAAREWLESIIGKSQSQDAAGEGVWKGGFFDALSFSGLRISRVQAGQALCSFRVPAHLTVKWNKSVSAQDGEGNWQAGAMATVMDDVGAAAIMTTEGLIKISVQFDISYFSPARTNEEVEIDARIMEHKGGRRLTAVVVEIRKKGNGQIVAVGRQWMTSGRPFHSNL